MYRIGEFSKYTCITIKALRYYDKIGLLVPKHVDPDSRYRYYSADQMVAANRITALKTLGFSLQEIDEILCQGQAEAHQLQAKLQEIKARIREDQQKLTMLNSILNANQEEDVMNTMDVVRKQVPPQEVLTLRRVIDCYQDQGALWMELNQTIAKNGAKPTGISFTVDYNEGYKEKDVDLMVCQVIDRAIPDQGDLRYQTLPGGEFASLTYRGPYEGIHQAYNTVLKWIEEQNLEICGPDREVYHENMATTDNPDHFVSELLIPIREK